MSRRSSLHFLRAWAEIDLGALARNIQELRRHSGNRALLVPVKANAYGHGAVQVAEAAVEAGSAFLGVATAEEGIALREADIEAPILILGSILEEEIEPALENGIDLLLSPAEIYGKVREAAKRLGWPARVHLMTDTGMSRYGISLEQTLELARRVAKDEWMQLVGVATHFVSSESEDSTRAQHQIEQFKILLLALEMEGLVPPLIHAANSGATLGLTDSHFNMLRPGLAVYGAYPSRRFQAVAALEPVMAVRARITHVRQVDPGTTVSYGARWAATRPTRLAVIPVGYADGWPTSLTGRVQVLFRGQRIPVVGRICMDCMIADVSEAQGVQPGDIVTLLGRDGLDCIRMEELAELSGRIPYEVTCGIGPRVHRKYLRPSCAPSVHSSNRRKKVSSRVSSLAPSLSV